MNTFLHNETVMGLGIPFGTFATVYVILRLDHWWVHRRDSHWNEWVKR